jgi:hypothetical protein
VITRSFEAPATRFFNEENHFCKDFQGYRKLEGKYIKVTDLMDGKDTCGNPIRAMMMRSMHISKNN